MSGPKLTRIFDELLRRVQQIAVANGYTSDIGLNVFVDSRLPQETEVPCSMIYMQERTVESTLNCRAQTTMVATVVGYVAIDDNTGYKVGFDILGDIQRAVESEDPTFGNLLSPAQYGLSFAADTIAFPEAGANILAVRVDYNAPHIRKTGDPEIV